MRNKWLQELGALLEGTGTTVAKILDNKAGDCNVIGGGRRASTLRAQVRAAQKYLSWAAVSAEVMFPLQVAHLTGFLETRHSEPCSRCALKGAHLPKQVLRCPAAVLESLKRSFWRRTPSST